MMSPADGAVPGSGRFSGRLAFQQLVREGLVHAAQAAWRDLVLCDPSFEDWPLGERDVITALQAWARPGRTLTLLARSYDALERGQPRFVQWRRTWDHLITCRACRRAGPLDLPSVLWSGAWVLERLDPVRSLGWHGTEPERRLRVRENLDGWMQKSAPAFPATTLGL